MRPTQWLKKGFSLSMLVVVTGVLGGGGIACGDEEFTCCECHFAMPAECTATDPAVMASEFILCSCNEGDPYTYESCGVYCKAKVPQTLAVTPELIGPAARPPFTCSGPVAMAGEPSETLAKGSCSIGSPVGE